MVCACLVRTVSRLRRGVSGAPFALGERKDRSKSPPPSSYDAAEAMGGKDPSTPDDVANNVEMYKNRIDAEITGTRVGSMIDRVAETFHTIDLLSFQLVMVSGCCVE